MFISCMNLRKVTVSSLVHMDLMGLHGFGYCIQLLLYCRNHSNRLSYNIFIVNEGGKLMAGDTGFLKMKHSKLHKNSFE